MKTVIALLLLSLALPAYAEDGPASLGYWYGNLNGDSRSMRNHSIMVFAVAVDSAAYGMSVEFNKPIDGELADARYKVIMACFGKVTREEAADGFATWAWNKNLNSEMPLGAAITVFLVELCSITDEKTKS